MCNRVYMTWWAAGLIIFITAITQKWRNAVVKWFQRSDIPLLYPADGQQPHWKLLQPKQKEKRNEAQNARERKTETTFHKNLKSFTHNQHAERQRVSAKN